MYRRFGETNHPPSTGRYHENLKSHGIYNLSIIFCRKADGKWKTQLSSGNGGAIARSMPMSFNNVVTKGQITEGRT